MLTFLMHLCDRRRFFRVEVNDKLCGEYSVVREWGARRRTVVVWFSNLREACLAAETWERRAGQRGFDMELAAA
jgi:hypothetical protein